jgi:copper chaperone CopZ
MKKVILSITVFTALGLISCKNETQKNAENAEVDMPMEEMHDSHGEDMATTDATFGVRGNCGMCKETIEKAAKSVDGVAIANWDKDKKKIDVKFDESKTDMMAIHNAIAASGYDTEKVSADEEAYGKLPECCQYDHDMMMNHMDGEMKEHDHSHE